MREWADLLIQPAMVKPDANEWLNRGAGITDYIAEPSSHRQDKGMLKQPLKIQIPQQALIAFCQNGRFKSFRFWGLCYETTSDQTVILMSWSVLKTVQLGEF